MAAAESINEIVDDLQEILGWLDRHKFEDAAIYVNQAIEVLAPTEIDLSDCGLVD
jgi:hypothetical protein